MVYPDVTDDRIFGYLSRLNINQYYDNNKVENAQVQIKKQKGLTIIFGSGATLIADNRDILVYADMARWEIQQRMRRNEVDNTGLKNRDIEDWMLLYKQGFFVDWRVLDRLKKKLMEKKKQKITGINSIMYYAPMISVISFLFNMKFVIETKGKNLEEISI